MPAPDAIHQLVQRLTDREIEHLISELYGRTDTEIKLVYGGIIPIYTQHGMIGYFCA
jgi:hypothetical protein